MPRSEWPGDTYPPFPYGGGYILSRGLARAIAAERSAGELPMLRLEDVSLGVWADHVRRKRGVRISFVDAPFSIGGCRKGYVIAHYVNAAVQRCMWRRELRTRGQTKPNICC